MSDWLSEAKKFADLSLIEGGLKIIEKGTLAHYLRRAIADLAKCREESNLESIEMLKVVGKLNQRIHQLEAERDGFKEDAAHRELDNFPLKQALTASNKLIAEAADEAEVRTKRITALEAGLRKIRSVHIPMEHAKPVQKEIDIICDIVDSTLAPVASPT